MFRVALLGVAGTCLAAATILGAPRPPARPRTPFVELGAVVVDDDGQLVDIFDKRTSAFRRTATRSR